MSKKYEISLVMKRDHSTAHKLGVLRKQSSQHTTHRVTKSGGEVVQNDLWFVRGRSSVAFDVSTLTEIAQLEVSSGSLRKMNQP